MKLSKRFISKTDESIKSAKIHFLAKIFYRYPDYSLVFKLLGNIGSNTYGIPYTNLGYGSFGGGLYGGYITYPISSSTTSSLNMTTTTTPRTSATTTTIPATPITEAIIFRPEVAAARH